MILHIPHASQETLDYDLKHKERELLRMTDHFTDELYQCDGAKRVVFGLSRLICDVERFEDDEQEPMSNFGMGVCYTKDTEGYELRDVKEDDKKEILERFYHPHHDKLTEEVDKALESNGTAFIVDCHSFPNEAYLFNSDYGKTRPDICIGTDSFHTPKELVQKVKKYFLEKGYRVNVDNPYTGTMVPLKHYRKNKNVHSIMLEVNRKLYMNEFGDKTAHFKELQLEIKELLESIKGE